MEPIFKQELDERRQSYAMSQRWQWRMLDGVWVFMAVAVRDDAPVLLVVGSVP